MKAQEVSMVNLRLPDGSRRSYQGPVTGQEVAESIGARLAKEAVAIRVNEELWDLTRPITQDASIEIITRTTPAGLEVLRHDAAHVFAEAVKELFPETQITIGPAIENGFYYDLYRDAPFTPEDLPVIEDRMREIVARDEPITREVWSRQQALEFFKAQGEHYKCEIISEIPEDQAITVYRQGNFTDLCRGPHLPSTGRLGTAFKLMKLAGAYWRGDSKNAMLQRVYGTAWATPQQLQDYLTQLAEAEKRDHRKLGRELQLFHQQEEAPGSVFWHPRGWQLYRTLQDYMRQRQEQYGYIEVRTPLLVDRSLWERSGHIEKFSQDMFLLETADNRSYALKPMNCPCHIELFKQGTKSYRDLPLRMAEFGACHRNESSGALHGMLRVRAFTQDDAHIFCTPDQILSETRLFCQMLKQVYHDLGFDEIQIRLSTRPAVRAGDDSVWDAAEAALEEAARASGLECTLNPGEGAFYGPKLEFHLRDAIGRSWQCGTFQLDFVLPKRLNATYIGEDGEKHTPVMLHRAILGTFERFLAIMIEQYAGHFPLWLAPVQVAVATITNESDAYGQEVVTALKKAGIRAITDLRNEKITYKIRELSLEKIPLIFVVGKREADEKTVAIRRLGGQAQDIMTLEQAIQQVVREARSPLEQEAK